ncbi:cupin domain-containing protein [Halorutilales archaeon Cl-col2-1]
MPVKRDSDVELEEVGRGDGVEVRRFITEDDGAPNFNLRKFYMEPGGGMPRHYHPGTEHEQYLIQGEIRLTLGGGDEDEHEDEHEETQTVESGDTVYIPAGTPHEYEVVSDEPAEFICVVPQGETETVFVDKE